MSDKGLVLVTGINGFIGSTVGLHLLQKGYRVRAAVRSSSKLSKLLGGVYAPFKDQLEIVEVADITEDGAFDDALSGVTNVLHLASPINFALQSPEEFVGPAVAGNLQMLKSAAKQPKNAIKSIVVTSSVAAVYDPTKPEHHVFTEADWNHATEAKVKNEGKETPSGMWYLASKNASERSLWEWVAENKPIFSITAINPGLVYGPVLALPESPDALNASLMTLWIIFSGEAKEVPESFTSGSFADVRDVAKLHIWAMENPEVANRQRYIAVAGQGNPQKVIDILRKWYPERQDRVLLGHPGVEDLNDDSFKVGGYSSAKAEKAAHVEWIGFEKTVVDSAKSLETWLSK